MKYTGEFVAGLVSDRLAGMSYKIIAERHHVSVPKLRHLLTKAVTDGLASANDLRYEPLPPKPAPDPSSDARWVEDVLTKIKIADSGCWIWQGRTATWGYGVYGYNGHDRMVHRQLYQIMNRVKLDRWQLIMHTCDCRLCCNPLHLRMGTPADNVLDAAEKGRHHNARKTHCKRGHEFTPENTELRVTPKSTLRVCKACQELRQSSPEYLEQHREYQRRKRALRKQEEQSGDQ